MSIMGRDGRRLDADPPAGGGGGAGTSDNPGGGGGGGGGETPEWMSALPDDLKASPSLQKYKDPAGLAKGYVDLERRFGQGRVSIPGREATAEEWGKFWNSVGRPEKPDEYEVPKQNMPEGVDLNDETLKAFFAEAHTIGLTKQQAAALVRWQAGLSKTAIEAHQEQNAAAREAGLNQLRGEWGDAFDQNLRLAQAGRKYLDKDGKLAEWLNQTGLGDEPMLLRVFERIGRFVGEDEVLGDGHTAEFDLTPAEAESAVNALFADAEFDKAYNDETHPGHKAAMEKYRKLMKAANPEPKTRKI